ncbi:hypothetical protein HDV05_003456, partial [Chytridiales sp. JEL 0842]
MFNGDSKYEPQLIGMRYDTPSVFAETPLYDLRRNNSAIIGTALIPGRRNFLGGSVLAMGTKTKVESLAWEYMTRLVNTKNEYIHAMGQAGKTLPPYLSAWSDPRWSGIQFEIQKMALAQAVSPQYPLQTFPQWGPIESKKPFRFMLMEMIYKNVSFDVALSRLQARVDDVFKLSITPGSYFTYENTIARVLGILAGIGIGIAVIFLGMIASYRQKKIIRSSSPEFNLLIICGTILGYATIFTNIGPTTNQG